MRPRRIPRPGSEWTVALRQRELDRAYLTGAITARTYAWLWHSLSRFGRRWRWN